MTTPYPDHPQLRGNYAPIRMECDIDDVIVRGELPTAHPKIDPTTGEMVFFGYMAGGMFSTDVSYQRVDAAGRLVHHDFARDRRSQYVLPDGDTTGEPVFVPRSKDAGEGEGYLLSVVHRAGENRSDLAFFDAENLADGPIACAELPHRVPYGFHGNWKYNDAS